MITPASLRKRKREGRAFACLTAYDAAFARAADAAGAALLLVGDSLGMLIQGYATTLPVTVDDVAYHCRCVARACERALIMADMPFMSCATVERALSAAERLMRAGAHAVKLEIGASRTLEAVRALDAAGVPVCAHLGVRPQWVRKGGGFRPPASGDEIETLAREACEAGAEMLLLECAPAETAKSIKHTLDAPVIGIGSGPSCDGQILVMHDVLGMRGAPPFAKDFLQGADGVEAAFRAYVEAVETGAFPPPAG